MLKSISFTFVLYCLCINILAQNNDYWHTLEIQGNYIVNNNNGVYVFGNNGEIALVNIESETKLPLESVMPEKWDSIYDYSWSENKLILATDIGVVELYETNEAQLLATNSNSPLICVDYHPNGDVYAGNPEGLFRYNANQFEIVNTELEVYDLKFLGETLYTINNDDFKIGSSPDNAVHSFVNNNWSTIFLEQKVEETLIRGAKLIKVEYGKGLYALGLHSIEILEINNQKWQYYDIRDLGRLQNLDSKDNKLWLASPSLSSDKFDWSASIYEITKSENGNFIDTISFSAWDGLNAGESHKITDVQLADYYHIAHNGKFLFWKRRDAEPLIGDKYTQTIGGNDFTARVNANGMIFNNTDNYSGTFSPGDTNLLIYNADLLTVAEKSNGEIVTASTLYSLYNEGYSSFLPGLANKDKSYKKPSMAKVSKEEIEYHKAHYTEPNYSMNWNIQNWPANGNPANDESTRLAPYEDVDASGIYSPENGDYPLILGDEMVYLIMNDFQFNGSTRDEAIGIEVHLSLYKFYSNEKHLKNTLFGNYKVINKSNTDYESFKAALFYDFDIGGSFDDYVGCDTLNNIFYAYNGDAFDEEIPEFGFKDNPPSCGVKVLCAPMKSFITKTDDYFDAQSQANFYHYINGRFKTGEKPIENGEEVNFMFSGDPVEKNGFTAADIMTPSEVSSITGLPKISPFEKGATVNYPFIVSYAFKENGDTTYLQSIYHLKDNLKLAANHFETELLKLPSKYQIDLDCSLTGISEQQNDFTLNFYPNPSNGIITIKLKANHKIKLVEVYNASGQLIIEKVIKNHNEKIDLTELNSGLYIIKATDTYGHSHQLLHKIIK